MDEPAWPPSCDAATHHFLPTACLFHKQNSVAVELGRPFVGSHQEDTTSGAWEQELVNIVLFFHSLWNHPLLNVVMIVLSKYGLVVSGAAFVIAMIRKRQRISLLAWATLGGAVSVAIVLLSGSLFVHPRPFVVLHTPALVAHPADNSFPSDHSAVAAFLAAALWFVDIPMAVIASAAALLVGIARIYCLLHWPIDIEGGWLIGAVPACVASLLWRTRNGSFAHHDRV